MNRTPYLAALLGLSVSAAASQAAAQQPAYPPQPYAYPAQPQGAYGAPQQVPLPEHTHDGGFFFRLQLGVGYSYTTYADADLSWSGVALDSTLSFGVSLPSSLALHLDILVDQTLSLDVTYMGSSASSDASYGTAGFGVGASYYLPSNAYFNGSLGIARANLTDADGDEIAASDFGLYLAVGAGREWWVARRFGIGVYGRLVLASLPDQDVDARFMTIVPAAGLSMTFD